MAEDREWILHALAGLEDRSRRVEDQLINVRAELSSIAKETYGILNGHIVDENEKFSDILARQDEILTEVAGIKTDLGTVKVKVAGVSSVIGAAAVFGWEWAKTRFFGN